MHLIGQADECGRHPPDMFRIGGTCTASALTSNLVIHFVDSLIGMLVALMVAGFNARRGKAKVRALVASDQVILQSLPPGSLAASVLDAPIQATVTMYACDPVRRSARWASVVEGVISAGLVAGMTLAWGYDSFPGYQRLNPFVTGFFAVNVVLCLRILLHRNVVSVTPDPEAAQVDRGVADESDNSSPTEKAAGQII